MASRKEIERMQTDVTRLLFELSFDRVISTYFFSR